MRSEYDDPMWLAYGPFQPGTVARAIRHENAARGFRTCWRCLAAFRPRLVIGADGRWHRLGRGRWYCSRRCALADRQVIVLDLRDCAECPA